MTSTLTEIPKWVISDTHFKHHNIGLYCQRYTPAHPTVEAVDELIRDNWHGLVQPNDDVLHLGDLGWYKENHDEPLLLALPGRKWFVRGNHDKVSTEWLERHGFTEIEPPTFTHEGVEIVCTHYPQDLGPKPTSGNIFGHVHNNPTNRLSLMHVNVSVEVRAFAPVLMREMLDKCVWGHKINSSEYGPRIVKPRTKRT